MIAIGNTTAVVAHDVLALSPISLNTRESERKYRNSFALIINATREQQHQMADIKHFHLLSTSPPHSCCNYPLSQLWYARV